MKGFIIAVAAGAIAFVLMLQVVPESMIAFSGETSQLILLALFVGAVNALIKPVINVLSIPISFLTLGLSGFVVNAALLLGIAYLAQTYAKLDLTIGGWPTSGMTRGHHPRGGRGIDGARADHDGGRARRPRLTATDRGARRRAFPRRRSSARPGGSARPST